MRFREFIQEKYSETEYAKKLGVKLGSPQEKAKLEQHFKKKIPMKYLVHYRRAYLEEETKSIPDCPVCGSDKTRYLGGKAGKPAKFLCDKCKARFERNLKAKSQKDYWKITKGKI